ncbi:hypothetical protein CPAR01_13774 [Colletotrichum paranaense]|uniref:Uncharacterized protein n=1 Tax=Colletotrichum paranaense TaxID=1914294 RepID=A0ABQ9S4A2_9PEZI|nr:uncharacterized protein CPAR01_13774 [Colletotrichum paranaense]KAK1524826.1 hypothetical protein CPAR01_13774 [Colletotrichum paranaense]
MAEVIADGQSLWAETLVGHHNVGVRKKRPVRDERGESL